MRSEVPGSCEWCGGTKQNAVLTVGAEALSSLPQRDVLGESKEKQAKMLNETMS